MSQSMRHIRLKNGTGEKEAKNAKVTVVSLGKQQPELSFWESCRGSLWRVAGN